MEQPLFSRNRTSEYLERRKEHKVRYNKHTQFLFRECEALYKKVPNPSPADALVDKLAKISPKLNKKTVVEFCKTCGERFGLILKSTPCDLCGVVFCVKCIELLSGVLKEGETMNICKRCKIIVTRDEKYRSFDSQLKKASSDPIFVSYKSVKIHLDAIIKLHTKFNYITISLSEPSHPNNKATFGEVYFQAICMGEELKQTWDLFMSEYRKFKSVKPNSSGHENMKINITKHFHHFEQEYSLPFKMLVRNLKQMQLNTVTNLYFIIMRTAIETRPHPTFWKNFGRDLSTLIDIVKRDLIKSAVGAGEEWEKYYKYVEDFVCQWDPEKKTEKKLDKKSEGKSLKKEGSLLNLTQAIELESEVVVVNKVSNILRGAINQVTNKLGEKNTVIKDSISSIEIFIANLKKNCAV